MSTVTYLTSHKPQSTHLGSMRLVPFFAHFSGALTKSTSRFSTHSNLNRAAAATFENWVRPSGLHFCNYRNKLVLCKEAVAPNNRVNLLGACPTSSSTGHSAARFSVRNLSVQNLKSRDSDSERAKVCSRPGIAAELKHDFAKVMFLSKTLEGRRSLERFAQVIRIPSTVQAHIH